MPAASMTIFTADKAPQPGKVSNVGCQIRDDAVDHAIDGPDGEFSATVNEFQGNCSDGTIAGTETLRASRGTPTPKPDTASKTNTSGNGSSSPTA